MSLGLILLIISNRARRRVQWPLWRLRLWLWPWRRWPPRHYLDHPSRLASHGLGSSRDNSLGVYESGSLEKHDEGHIGIGTAGRVIARRHRLVNAGAGAPLTIPSLR
jgi:hypothetical protein